MPDVLEVVVTDQALVRYLERVRGLHLDAVRAEILATAGAAAAIGGKVLRKSGHPYVFEQGRIITVLPDDRQRVARRRP